MKKLYVVGFGAGNYENMTLEAKAAMEESDVIIGYSTYVSLMKAIWPEKEYMETPMRREVDRCRMALEEAQKGRTVAMVCSGDSGIYGMAGLIYELAEEYPQVEILVVSGVTAASSGAALLGAPLTHDFAVISLSDLLTPWEKIEKRLELAAEADLVVCLYNPASRKRADYLEKACDILMRHKGPRTVCGYARNIGREGQETKVMTLAELREEKLDMFTTVFIGNEQTRRMGDKMVTPRGYRLSE